MCVCGGQGTAAATPSRQQRSGGRGRRCCPAGSAPTPPPLRRRPSGGGRGRRGRAAHLSLEYSSRSSRRLRMKAMEPPGLGVVVAAAAAAATAGQARPGRAAPQGGGESGPARGCRRAGRQAGRQRAWRTRRQAPAPFIRRERRGRWHKQPGKGACRHRGLCALARAAASLRPVRAAGAGAAGLPLRGLGGGPHHGNAAAHPRPSLHPFP